MPTGDGGNRAGRGEGHTLGDKPRNRVRDRTGPGGPAASPPRRRRGGSRPPPFRGSGLPAAASASRTARAPHRDLAGGGTGSASARPSRAAGARCPPSASRQPLTSRSGPALGSASGASVSAQPARPAHLSTASQARRAGTQNHARRAAAPSRAGFHSRTGSRRRDRKWRGGDCAVTAAGTLKKKFKATKNFIGSSRRGQSCTQAN